MRLPRVIGLSCGAMVVLLGADVLARFQWGAAAFEEACYQFVVAEGTPGVPAVPTALKALAVGQRQAVVEALGARAKAYFASEAFKRTWIERHGGRYRDAAQDRRDAEALGQRKGAEAQMTKSMADMEKMLPMLPPAMQEQVRGELAKAKAGQARKQAKAASRGTAAAAEGVAIPDAQAALRKALTRFLQVSEGVEFNTPLLHRDHRSYFSNPAYEAKPDVWKACFRAGREGTEAARAYAKAWLIELK